MAQKPEDGAASKVQRRAAWLNSNVFVGRAIDDEAVRAMLTLSIPRAMEIFKDVEEKAKEIHNPSKYLKVAVRREAEGQQPGSKPSAPAKRQKVDEELSKIHKRVTWLNTNVLQGKTIDNESIDALLAMGIGRSFDLLKEVEEKASQINNPSGYIKTAFKRESDQAEQPPVASQVTRGDSSDDFSKIHRRVTWLNTNTFQGKPPIDEIALEALASLGIGRSFELLKEMEEKADQIQKPTGYIVVAAKKEGFQGDQTQQGSTPLRGDSGDDFGKIHRRVTWLNTNTFQGKPAIDEKALEALAFLGIGRSFELLKEMEEKADQIQKPSGYIVVAAKKEGYPGDSPGQPVPIATRGDSSDDFGKIHRRVTWLNTNTFLGKPPIDDDALQALAALGIGRSFELLKEMEEKADQIQKPTGYIVVAAKKEGFVPPQQGSLPSAAPAFIAQPIASPRGNDDYGKIHRRVTWLNSNTFQSKPPIEEKAIEVLSVMGLGRALELLKDMQEKADEIKSPTAYIIGAAKREGALSGPAVQLAPVVLTPRTGHGRMNDEEFSKLHRRVTWLNSNVLNGRPSISDEAIDALTMMGLGRALELLKDMEEKIDEIKNASGYIIGAAKREGALQSGVPMGNVSVAQMQILQAAPMMQAARPSDQDRSTISRRITWLNTNTLANKPAINDVAKDSLLTLPVGRALELLKDVEEKSDQINNPSAYIKVAVQREGSNAAPVQVVAFQAPSMQMPTQMPSQPPKLSSEEEKQKIFKRAQWLNANVFQDRKVDDDAVGAMFGMGIARAFELFKEIEAKANELRNPSGYLKTAAAREGLVPPSAVSQAPPPALGGQPKNSPDFDKIHRKVTWMNNHVFADAPIDNDAIDAIAQLGADRAIQMLDDLKSKGAEVKNPSGYLKVAVTRESGRLPQQGVKRTLSSTGGPPIKKPANRVARK